MFQLLGFGIPSQEGNTEAALEQGLIHKLGLTVGPGELCRSSSVPARLSRSCWCYYPLHSSTKELCSVQSHDLWGSQLTQNGICPNLQHSDVDSWLDLQWVPVCGRGKNLWAFTWGRGKLCCMLLCTPLVLPDGLPSCPGPFQGLSQLFAAACFTDCTLSMCSFPYRILPSFSQQQPKQFLQGFLSLPHLI